MSHVPHRREHDSHRQPDLDLEGVDWSWTSESQDERAQAELEKRHRVMPLSDNGQDIENSKRSRGERL
jgi:hypothetical protein